MNWISVKDHLPKNATDNLTYSVGVGTVSITIQDFLDGSWENEYFGYNEKVTHWQPLPDPPDVKTVLSELEDTITKEFEKVRNSSESPDE